MMKLLNQADRRGTPRINLYIDGTIKSSETYEPISCIVRNISQTGVTLYVENVDDVPDSFRLHLEHEGFSAECIVVWRSKTQVGVVFESAPNL